MARRSWIVLAVVAVLVTASAVTALMWRRLKEQPFTEQRVVAVTLELYGPPYGRAVAKAEESDAIAVRRLTQMLDRGTSTEPHSCVNIGHLSLKRADGSQFSLEILPGHDARFFEYRYGGVYRRIDRSDFMQSVAPFGVPIESFVEPAGQSATDAVDQACG
jgi:hypothetical protein